MEDINLLLSYIETEVLDGKKPFMGGGVIVDGESILNLIKRIRTAFNQLNGEALLEEAQYQAKQIMAQAKQRRDEYLDQNVIVKEARVIAQRIKDDAIKRKIQTEEQLKAFSVKIMTDAKAALIKAENDVDEIIAHFKQPPVD